MDESKQDEFYLVVHDYREDTTIDAVCIFIDSTTCIYWAADTPSGSTDACIVLDPASYTLGDTLQPVFVKVNGQSYTSQRVTSVFEPVLSRWTADLLDDLDPIFEELGIDISLHDLGFENL